MLFGDSQKNLMMTGLIFMFVAMKSVNTEIILLIHNREVHCIVCEGPPSVEC